VGPSRRRRWSICRALGRRRWPAKVARLHRPREALPRLDGILSLLPDRSIFDAATSLKAVFVPFTGINHLPVPLLLERGVRVYEASPVMRFGSGTPTVAQTPGGTVRAGSAVIALNGLPCGKVVAVKVLAENDYAATCQDGNKYHVFMNEAGRVVVEKAK